MEFRTVSDPPILGGGATALGGGAIALGNSVGEDTGELRRTTAAAFSEPLPTVVVERVGVDWRDLGKLCLGCTDAELHLPSDSSEVSRFSSFSILVVKRLRILLTFCMHKSSWPNT